MSNNEKDDSRHSRWSWRAEDITIIKKGDTQAENTPDQPKGEAAATDDKISQDTSDQDHESKKP